MTIPLHMIACMDKFGVIGKNGSIPWRYPADLKRFREYTMGGAMIMGRKTWESIGKPLPGRTTIVVTAGHLDSQDNLFHTRTLEGAVQLAEGLGLPKAVVVGGTRLYDEAMDTVVEARLYTIRDLAVRGGDAYFPLGALVQSALVRHAERTYTDGPEGSEVVQMDTYLRP